MKGSKMEKEWFNVKVAYVNINGRTFQIKPIYKDSVTKNQDKKESEDLRLHVKELFRK